MPSSCSISFKRGPHSYTIVDVSAGRERIFVGLVDGVDCARGACRAQVARALIRRSPTNPIYTSAGGQ